MYHKACFKCIECAVRLTLTTVKVSLVVLVIPRQCDPDSFPLAVLSLECFCYIVSQHCVACLRSEYFLRSLFHYCSLIPLLFLLQVSDFHGDSIYCNKCVPKQAPSQSEASMELERAGRASKLVQDVRLVNEQVRGAEETLGKPTHAIPK